MKDWKFNFLVCFAAFTTASGGALFAEAAATGAGIPGRVYASAVAVAAGFLWIRVLRAHAARERAACHAALTEALAELRATKRAPQARSVRSQCTGRTALWCPIHGYCSCREHDVHAPLDKPDCPLHAPTSRHR